jgi:hypothetical protein
LIWGTIKNLESSVDIMDKIFRKFLTKVTVDLPSKDRQLDE